MRASPDQSLRRQILADLGIEVWRLRTGRPPEVTAAAGRPPRDGTDAGVAARPGAAAGSARVAGQPGGSNRSAADPGGVAPAAASRPAARSQGAAPAEALSVLSYSAGGMTLLLGQRPAGREARLVRDLFAAVCGRWDVDPVSRVFDWPPAIAIPGAQGEGAADRALRAFVEKEVADQHSTLIVVERALAARLQTLRFTGEQVGVPDLAALGRDSQEKRRLWSVLGRHARSAARATGGPSHPDAGRGTDDPA